MSEEHLAKAGVLFDGNLADVGEQDELCESIAELGLNIAEARAWTFAGYDTPPFCNNGILSSSQELREETARQMQTHFKNILLLEHIVHKVPIVKDAGILRHDLTFLDEACIRFVYEAFAHDNFNPNSSAGHHAQRGLSQILPDNKPVEDIQSGPACSVQSNPNNRASTNEVQATCIDSNIFTSRGIKHPMKVTKEQYISGFAGTSAESRKWRHECRSHALDKKIHEVLGPRTSVVARTQAFVAFR